MDVIVDWSDTEIRGLDSVHMLPDLTLIGKKLKNAIQGRWEDTMVQ